MNVLPSLRRSLTIGVLLAACSLGFGSSPSLLAARARLGWGFFAFFALCLLGPAATRC